MIDRKNCSKCKVEKDISNFRVRKDRKSGYQSHCIDCQRQAGRLYHKKNAKLRIERTMKWRNENPEKYKQYHDSRKDKNREYQREYVKNRKKTDLNYFLKIRWRKLIYQAVRYKGVRKKGTTIEILGYDHNKLRQRIECQFKDGMSWSNYGEWEIDHKKPISSFIDYKKVNMLCNLQPLWKEENRKKGNKYEI